MRRLRLRKGPLRMSLPWLPQNRASAVRSSIYSSNECLDRCNYPIEILAGCDEVPRHAITRARKPSQQNITKLPTSKNGFDYK